METHDVLIIGAGPAGIAAACELRKRGINDVVIIERENEAGGVPRHCGHPPFGMIEFKRIMNGPAYARRLRQSAAGIDIRTSTTVTRIHPDGLLSITSPGGEGQIQGRKVLLATGARETPRSARLVSGTRPVGVMNTGALQQFVFLQGIKPMRRAVVVGTELVSFSCLLTLRHAGIIPVAMLEENDRVTVQRIAALFPRFVLRVPIYYRATITAIEGRDRVEAVLVKMAGGEERRIACDGVVFTGQYIPENALLKGGHLQITAGPGAPQIDQSFQCSDPVYYAAGNVLRPVEAAGWAYREGRAAGAMIANDLQTQGRAETRSIPITWSAPIKIVTPQRISLPGPELSSLHLKLRVNRRVEGRLRMLIDGGEFWSRNMEALTERRINLPRNLPDLGGAKGIHIEFEEK